MSLSQEARRAGLGGWPCGVGVTDAAEGVVAAAGMKGAVPGAAGLAVVVEDVGEATVAAVSSEPVRSTSSSELVRASESGEDRRPNLSSWMVVWAPVAGAGAAARPLEPCFRGGPALIAALITAVGVEGAGGRR